jgi:hypothetical protein
MLPPRIWIAGRSAGIPEMLPFPVGIGEKGWSVRDWAAPEVGTVVAFASPPGQRRAGSPPAAGRTPAQPAPVFLARRQGIR